jgi:hypothetical protein
MSKLADAIRRSQRVEAAPMGFGAARPAPKPSMLAGALVAANGVEAAVKAGADFVMIDAFATSLSPDDAKKARAAAGDVPLGAGTKVANSAAAKALREAGLDFLVIDDAMPASALLDDDLGYVLALPASPEETFLRSIDALSLEALYLPQMPSPLTVAAQLELGRVAALGRKPLLCLVASNAAADDLQCLRAAGVVAVLASEGVEALKAAVAALPLRKTRREERAVVSLPRGQAPAAPEEDDDD